VLNQIEPGARAFDPTDHVSLVRAKIHAASLHPGTLYPWSANDIDFLTSFKQVRAILRAEFQLSPLLPSCNSTSRSTLNGPSSGPGRRWRFCWTSALLNLFIFFLVIAQ